MNYSLRLDSDRKDQSYSLQHYNTIPSIFQCHRFKNKYIYVESVGFFPFKLWYKNFYMVSYEIFMLCGGGNIVVNLA